MQVLILNATGRMPSKRMADWFDASFLCASWPDSRIWCNQIGALGGTMRTPTAAATLAGTLAADSRAYGVPPILECMEFITRAVNKKKNDIAIEDIISDEFSRHVGHNYVAGYSRPIANGDIRIPTLKRIRRKLGFSKKKHVKMAFEVEKYLRNNYGEQINTAGYLAAFLVDQGYSVTEVERIYVTIVSSVVMACYADVRDRAPDAFLPLHCGDIKFRGKKRRLLPDSS